MYRSKPKAIVALAAMLASVTFAAPAWAQQSQACVAFEHANFGGAGRALKENEDTRRSTMDNQISSFRMIRGCHVEAYAHEDFKGNSTRWDGDVAFVGRYWNDVISSWRCVCPGRPVPGPRVNID